MKAITAVALLAAATATQAADFRALTDTYCQNVQQQDIWYSEYQPYAVPSWIEYSTLEKSKPYIDIRYTKPIGNMTMFPSNYRFTGNDSTMSTPFNGDFNLEEGESFSWGTKASEYAAGATRVDVKCSGGHLAYYVQLNGWDTRKSIMDEIVFGGPHVSLAHRFNLFNDPIKPFADPEYDNIFLQGWFTPFWNTREESVGQVNFNFFLNNIHTKEVINYVVTVADSRDRNLMERPIGTDPNTNAYWVSSYIGKDTDYVTKSRFSHPAQDMTREPKEQYEDSNDIWKFFRINLSKEQFQEVLDKIGSDSKPEDFALGYVAVQTEITYTREQTVGFGVRGFRTYLSKEVM